MKKSLISSIGPNLAWQHSLRSRERGRNDSALPAQGSSGAAHSRTASKRDLSRASSHHHTHCPMLSQNPPRRPWKSRARAGARVRDRPLPGRAASTCTLSCRCGRSTEVGAPCCPASFFGRTCEASASICRPPAHQRRRFHLAASRLPPTSCRTTSFATM